MFSEALKFKPQVDRSTLNKMARTLGTRFARISKKFGKGMKNSFKFGPLLALGGALLAKLLNPLKKAEDVLDRILAKGDDAATNAQQLGSDPGSYLRLQALAQARGVSPELLDNLLTRFQVALSKEQNDAKDPNSKPGTLRAFVDEKDTARAFFSFVQALQKVDKSLQVETQSLIFGDRNIGKAAELFNSTNNAEILNQLPSAEALGKAANRSAALSDQRDKLSAVRDAQDFVNKTPLLTDDMLVTIDFAERQKLKAEDEDLKRFDELKAISGSVQELTNQFNSFATEFLKTTAPIIVDGITEISKGMKIMAPFLESGAVELKAGFDKTIETVGKLSVSIGDYFNEFKSSRLYKMFGG